MSKDELILYIEKLGFKQDGITRYYCYDDYRIDCDVHGGYDVYINGWYRYSLDNLEPILYFVKISRSIKLKKILK